MYSSIKFGGTFERCIFEILSWNMNEMWYNQKRFFSATYLRTNIYIILES